VSLNEGGTRIIRGEKIVIGTGTHATIADLPGLRESNPLTHIEALELDYVPRHLIVLGGGYIGLELAQAMRRFGSSVTIVDQNERLANREDEDVSAGLTQLCKDEGIELVMSAEVSLVEGASGQSIKLHVRQGDSNRVVEGTDLLVATGRTPNTTVSAWISRGSNLRSGDI
jgi:pyruvate/2-oxoglutarate dehydrogenase complex dihydrolipoamide dehydrogenase (E3) component